MAKNILIISDYIPPRNSGAGQRAYNHFLMLKREGYKVNIVTQKPSFRNGIKSYLEIEDYITLEGNIIEIQTKNFSQNSKNILIKVASNVFSVLKIFYQLNSKIKKKEFDIVHGFTSSILFFSTAFYIKSKNRNVKTIAEITGLNPPGKIYMNKKGFINKVIYSLSKFIFHFIDKIVTLSPANDKSFTDFFGNNKKNILITNGVCLQKFSPINDNEKFILRKELNFGKNDLILINIGAVIAKGKRIDLFEGLIKILGKSCLKNKIRFIFVGNFDRTEKHLEVYKKLLSMNENYSNISITFLGHSPDVNKFIKISNIGIFMMERDGLPNSVIECMACGVPVVYNRIPGITDFIIEDNVDSFIADNNNLQTYADKIISLSNNKELYDFISSNARKKIESKFDTKTIFKEYKKLYKEF